MILPPALGYNYSLRLQNLIFGKPKIHLLVMLLKKLSQDFITHAVME